MTKLVYLILSLLASTVLISPTENQLIGSWCFSDGRETFCLLKFSDKGKFSGYIDKSLKRFVEFEGSWQLRGNDIFYTYEKSNPPNIFSKNGGNDKDEIVDFTSSYFVVKNANNLLLRYNKVKPSK